MRSPSTTRPYRLALVGFLALDLVGLVALLFDQLLSDHPVYPWVIALGMVLIALPLLGQAVDYVLAPPSEAAIVPDTGEKIP